MNKDCSEPEPSVGSSADDQLADDLHQIAQRDLAALNRLFTATYGPLLRICARITRNQESAEDVLQEVYIKVWNRAAGYDRKLSRPMVWLGRLARNSAIDWYRAQTARLANTLPDAYQLHDDRRMIDDELIEQEQNNRALAMIDDLSDPQRETIRDVYFKGLTYAQLAERDGIPLGTVKSRIHRTLIQLSQKWHRD